MIRRSSGVRASYNSFASFISSARDMADTSFVMLSLYITKPLQHKCDIDREYRSAIEKHRRSGAERELC